MTSRPESDRRTAYRVLEATAAVYGVDADEALANRFKTHGLAEAKHAAVLVLWRYLGWEQTRIGDALGRSRKTIHNSVTRAIELTRSADDWYSEALRRGEAVAMRIALGPRRPSSPPRWSLPVPLTRGAA